MVNRFLAVARDGAWLIVRICLGVILIVRGWTRWQITGIDHQVAYLERTGTPFAELVALGGVGVEMVGGFLLIFGAATPVVAGLLLIEQAMIIAWTKWYRGLSLNGVWGDGWEYTLITICVCLLLVVHGAGRASIDHLVRRRRNSPSYDPEDD